MHHLSTESALTLVVYICTPHVLSLLRYSSLVQFSDGSLGVQWDDGSQGPVTHAGATNETFVRLSLAKA